MVSVTCAGAIAWAQSTAPAPQGRDSAQSNTTAAHQPAVDPAIAAAKPYVDQLGDPDPAVRANATTMLITMGAAARPAVLPIADSLNPEVKIRARLVLSKLPWARSTDNIGVKTLLRRYSSFSPYQQQEFVSQLINRGDKAAVDTKLRLLCEEIDTTIGWRIAMDIAENPQNYDPAVLRELPVYMSRSSIFMAKAMGYRDGDIHKMMDLLMQAIDIELENPSDEGRIQNLLNSAQACARYLQDEQRLAEVTRKFFTITDVNEDTYDWLYSPPVMLMALHVESPMMSGLGDDIWLIRRRTTEPAVLHAIGEVYDARGNPFAGAAFHSTALHSQPLDPKAHGLSGYQLKFSQLNRSALAEFALAARYNLAGIQEPDVELETAKLGFVWNTQLQVSILMDMGEYQQVLQLIEAGRRNAQDLIPPGTLRDRANQLFDQMHDPAQMHLALEKKDPSLATDEIETFIQANEANPEVLSVVIPLLKMKGQEQRVRPLVQQSLKNVREMVKESPNSPESLNSMAWTMYLCHENLPEAQKLAEQALKLDPINGAIMDTLANICFELGEVQRAVELETVSLRQRPGDPFIRRRLATFRAAQMRDQ